jgi:hypothetical protein
VKFPRKVLVRLEEDEYQALCLLARARGLGQAATLRRLIRRAAGIEKVDAPQT